MNTLIKNQFVKEGMEALPPTVLPTHQNDSIVRDFRSFISQRKLKSIEISQGFHRETMHMINKIHFI